MLLENKFHMVIIVGCKDGKVHIIMNLTENIETLLENMLKLTSCLLFTNGMKIIKFQKKFMKRLEIMVFYKEMLELRGKKNIMEIILLEESSQVNMMLSI
jgi:hypothetical protein